MFTLQWRYTYIKIYVRKSTLFCVRWKWNFLNEYQEVLAKWFGNSWGSLENGCFSVFWLKLWKIIFARMFSYLYGYSSRVCTSKIRQSFPKLIFGARLILLTLKSIVKLLHFGTKCLLDLKDNKILMRRSEIILGEHRGTGKSEETRKVWRSLSSHLLVL